MHNNSLIACCITCTRGLNKIFYNINLNIKSGEMLRVIGPNGSGKSSLLRLLSGILHPSEGEIRLNSILINEIQLKAIELINS